MDKKFCVFVLMIGLFVVSLFVGEETKSASVGEDGLNVYYFYGQGCPHCARVAPFIAEMEQKYPLRIHRFDIYGNRSCLSVFDEYSNLYGLPLERRGVPAVFVSDTYFVGDDPIIEGFEEAVKNALIERSSTDQSSKVEVVESSGGKFEPSVSSFSIFTFMVAALVDSISPCSIAVLVFLVGARVLVSDRRKRALKVGLAFCLSVFIGYFLFGLGLLTFVQFSGFSGIFSLLVGVIAVLIGLFYLKDVFWYGGGGFVMEVPRSLKPSLMKLLKGVASPFGAFVVGFVVICFELPCTGGPYLFILGQLANSATRLQAVPLLLFYCFIFVVPLIMISLLLYSNFFSIGRVREWNEGNKRLLRLIGGFAMVALGFLVIPVSQVLLSIQLFLRFFKVAGTPLLVLMFLYFFVSFAKRNRLGSRLTGPPGRAILLASLCVAVVFTVPASTILSIGHSSTSGYMTDLTLGYDWLPFPFYALRCPGKPLCGPEGCIFGAVWGEGEIVVTARGDWDRHLEVYGKYKSESVWNRLGGQSDTDTCDPEPPMEPPCSYPNGFWIVFTTPKPPDKESTFQLWVLGRACPAGCSPPYLTPEGVPKDYDIEVQTEYDVFAIKEIKIEGIPENGNPKTGPGREVRYTAELPSGDLGAYSAATSEVSWEVKPIRRKTMSPHRGGAPIKKETGNGNPWKHSAPIDTHGKKTVKATVTWSMNGQEVCKVEKEKDYILFFRKDARDYSLGAPNWFIYWSGHDDKAVTTSGFDHTGAFKFDAGTGAWGYTIPPDPTIWIGALASKGCGDMRPPGAYPDNPAYSLPQLGIYVNHRGIDCLALILGHETCHQRMYEMWTTSWKGLDDTDCDGIPDSVERLLGFDPALTDSSRGAFYLGASPTIHGFSPAPDPTHRCAGRTVPSMDAEIFCHRMGQYNTGTSKKDWAYKGKQSKPIYSRPQIESGLNATFDGTFNEFGLDTNADSLFDFLVVATGISVFSPGTYTLEATLTNSQGHTFGASNFTFLDTGNTTVPLFFDGAELRKERVDGPFNIKLRLFGNSTDDYAEINTSAYSYKQFQTPKVEIIGSYSEATVDTNGNSLFDRLDIAIAVNVTQAGYYTIAADLNKDGHLASSTNSSFLNTGEQHIILSFDGLRIRSYRTNGPYSLKFVEVLDQDYNQTDFVQDAYTTSAYLYTQFERPKAEFTGRFGNFGVDTDANGLFNILRIEAEVDAQEAGNYTFSVDLADISDNEITHNYTYVWLNPGTQNITIDLNGTAIGDHGVNGPYVLTSLALYELGGFPLSVEVDYHNTSAYSYPQFERSGITEKVHDIAVTNVTPSQTLVYPGETIPIYVTIENQGNYTETLNVTVYANTAVIQTQVVILESESSETVPFTWDTTGFAEGNYTISAQAWPVLATEEPDTPDNTFTNGTIYVIPEFPSALILPLLMVLTMLAVFFAKKKAARKPELSPRTRRI